MRERARRICFLLSESSWVHTQQTFWVCTHKLLRAPYLLYCYVFVLQRCLTFDIRLFGVSDRRETGRTSAPKEAAINGRFPVWHTWWTSADRLRRPRVNTDVETGGITNLSQAKLMMVAMTNLRRVRPDEVLEEQKKKKEHTLLLAFPNKCQPKDQWKINMSMCNCVPTHVCLYVTRV